MEPIITKPTILNIDDLIKMSKINTRTYWSVTYSILYLIFLGIYIYMAVLLSSFWFLFAGVAFMIMTLYTTSASFSEFARDKHNRYMFDECTYTFEQDKFTCEYVNGSIAIKPYNTLVKRKTSPDFYLLFIDSISFFPVSKESFKTEEDHQRFRELFNFNA